MSDLKHIAQALKLVNDYGKIVERIEPDWEAIDEKRRRDSELSEAAYNCPRGEWR